MLETRIDALDFLAQLKGETVLNYSASSRTIALIVADLIALQVHATPITVGTISASIAVLTRSIEVTQDSIYSVITKLRDTVGGYIEVDVDRKFNWLDDIGENKGQQIRYRKNIIGLSRVLDFFGFGNKLYCYGAGEGTARIKLSDAGGMTEDYVEDVASQLLYGDGIDPQKGICIRQLVEPSITHPDTLKEWAILKLAEMKDPQHTYRVDMINLEAMGWSFEAIQLGSYVKVIDEDLGVDINARIVMIDRDLTNPENIVVEISNPGKDIVDTLTGVYDAQQLNSHIATQIGAGQVLVLGDFAVLDWVTGGTTNIKGDYIRTGVIQSTNWGVGAGSEINLNTGTFKLGGSASPKLCWDGTTLTVYGVISVGGAAADVNAYATTISGGKITANSLDANTIKASSLSVALSITAGGSVVCGPVTLNTEGAWINGTNKALIFKDTLEMGCIRYSSLTNTLYIETSVVNKNISLSAGGYLYLYGAYGISTSSNIVAQNGINIAKGSYPSNTNNGTMYYDTVFNILVIRKAGAWKEVLTS